MKKFICTLLCMTIICNTLLPTFAATGVISNGKTLVPIRGVFEELGFNVNWDNATATAIISDGTYTIQIPKGKTYFITNGKSIKPDVPQQVINGNLYLPLRAIGDSIGAATSWDSTKKIAHINYNGKDSYVSCNNTSSTNKTYTTTSSSVNSTSTKISGVRDSLYNDVTSYMKSLVTKTDFKKSASITDADVMQNDFDIFLNQAQNQNERLFVLYASLVSIDYMLSNIYLNTIYYKSLQLSLYDSTTEQTLQSAASALDMYISVFCMQSNTLSDLEDIKNEIDTYMEKIEQVAEDIKNY